MAYYNIWEDINKTCPCTALHNNGQQLDESKEDKREVADVEDSLVTEGEHDKVEDKAEMGDI